MVELSQRAQQISDSQTLSISAKANALRLEGVDVVSFGAGEPDFDTPEPIRREAVEAINEGFTRYTPVCGILPLRQVVAAQLGAPYGPDDVLICAGAKQALYNLFQATLDPGDEVLIPTPYWTSYPDQVRLAGGKPILVPTGAGFVLDVEQMRQRLTDRTRAIVLNTPCNPTGQTYTEAELEPVAELAREHGLLVVSDEIYQRLVYGQTKHVSIVTQFDLREQGVIVSGVSKTYAMTGWRIGYAAGPAEIIGAMTRIQSHSTSCANAIAQRAALAALTGSAEELTGPMIREFDKRRMYIITRLKNISGITVAEPAGAFFAFPKVSRYYGKRAATGQITDSNSFAAALLEQHNVVVVPGIAFGADEYVRMSYALGIDEIEKGLDRFEEFLSSLK